jgi:hypothetical protein
MMVQFSSLSATAGRGRPTPPPARPCIAREKRGYDQFHARDDLKAARAADHEVAANLRVLGSADQLVRVAGQEVDGEASQLGEPGLIEHIALGPGDVRRSFCGFRAMAVAAWPRRDNSLAISEPVRPKAPATAIFIEGLLCLFGNQW